MSRDEELRSRMEPEERGTAPMPRTTNLLFRALASLSRALRVAGTGRFAARALRAGRIGRVAAGATRDPRLDALLLACLDRLEAGGEPALRAFLAAHPCDADPLRSRLCKLDEL